MEKEQNDRPVVANAMPDLSLMPRDIFDMIATSMEIVLARVIDEEQGKRKND